MVLSIGGPCDFNYHPSQGYVRVDYIMRLNNIRRMKVIQLQNRFSNGFTPEQAEEAEANLAEFQAVYDAVVDGKAFIRFTDGDRKGAIARLAIDPAYNTHRPTIGYRATYWNDKNNRQLEHTYIWCVATWDGRKNKIKVSVPDREAEILLDYDGPTIWEKFDAKAAKETLLQNPNQTDIKGNVLSLGDPVLYINARYGSRMTLEEGQIVEFLVSVDSKSHTFTTVIESQTGERSSLQYPESMVYLMP